MKKSILVIALLFPMILVAHSMDELFEALKNHPQTKLDIANLKQANIGKKMVYSKLLPKIDLVGSYDNYSTPTGMVPVPPNKLLPMVKNPSVAQPFSENIYRAGVKLSMPLFVKSIYTNAKKLKVLQNTARLKKIIDEQKNMSILVDADANLLYLDSLIKALNIKKKSLLKSKQTIDIQVKSGRLPQIASYKIENAINEISIKENSIKMQKQKAISLIYSLTGIKLQNAIDLEQLHDIQKNEIFLLKPLKEKIKAQKLELQATKEKLYPSLALKGSYIYSKADAYNNDKSVNEHYSDIGIGASMPLFSMTNYRQIQMEKVKLLKKNYEYQKAKDELIAQTNMLEKSLKLLDKSIKLHKKNVQNQNELLKVAKISFESLRLSTEEYLRYEDAYIMAKAKLYEAQAKRWQTLMQLAVIYNNNIEELIK